jgi:hypothetical protein
MSKKFAKFLFEKMPPKKEEHLKTLVVTAESSAEEIQFAKDWAKKQRGIAKQQFSRVLNQFHAILSQNPETPHIQAKAESLMNTLEDRYARLHDRCNDFEQLAEPEEEEHLYFQEIEDTMSKIQDAFFEWQLKHDNAMEAAKKPDPVYSVIGLNFDVRKSIKDKFSGGDSYEYSAFRLIWDSISEKLTEMKYTDAQKLAELKKCLEKEALAKIHKLPLEDAHYQKALEILDINYRNNIRIAELAISDMLNTPKMVNTAASAEKVQDAILQMEQTLMGLKLTEAEQGNLMKIVLWESKLNPTVARQWIQLKNKKKNLASPLGHDATKEDLLNLIIEYRQTQEYMEKTKSEENKHNPSQNQQQNKQAKKGDNKNQTIVKSFGVQKSEQKGKTDKTCAICKKPGHIGPNCFEITKIQSPEERNKFIKNLGHGICRQCLLGNHMTQKCHQPICSKCDKKGHHTLLHEDRSSKVHHTQDGPSTSSAQVSSAMTNQNKKPILETCISWVVPNSKEKYSGRIFFDNGSERTFITQDFAKELGLDGPTTDLQMSLAGGHMPPPTKEKLVKFQLQSLDGSYISPKIEAITTKEITKDLRAINIDPKDYPHLAGIAFTETYPRKEVKVDILIGNTDYATLRKGEIIRGQLDEPIAVATKLGYILSGSA